MKQLIITALALEDITPEDIASDMILFGEGLGLDSVDALELGMALHKQYGIEVKAEDDATREYFTNVEKLAAFVAEYRQTESTV